MRMPFLFWRLGEKEEKTLEFKSLLHPVEHCRSNHARIVFKAGQF